MPAETPASDPTMSLTGWDLARRAPRVEDALLLADTRDLLGHLPPAVRPQQLPLQYPRIANRIKELWPHTAQLKGFLEGLVEDARGGRRGFSPLVDEELHALRLYIDQRQEPFDTRWAT
jgi:hypothetical protein